MIRNWLGNIEFAYPWLLALLLLIPILVIEYLARRKKNEAWMMVTTTHFIEPDQSFAQLLNHIPFALRMVAIFCLVVAIARPQLVNQEKQLEGEGIDIVLCFDISGSMMARDFSPNRLEAAKQVATDFVNNRTGDRIGIVIFSNQSYTLCPITTDHRTVINQINEIQSGYLLDDGTAIGSGLATSVDRLRASNARSKIIILLTDGVDFGGVVPPDIAKNMAKLYNIKIYSIGIGSEKEMEETVNTPFGTINQAKRLDFNEGLLKQLAAETNGHYFHAANKEALEKIYVSINQLEKSKIKSTVFNRYEDVYQPWVIAALTALLLEGILRLTFLRKFP